MLATMRTGAIGFVAGLLTAAIIAAIIHFRHGQPAVVAALAPELANLKTEDVPIKSVKAYPHQAKRKLNLSAAVQANKDEHVVAATKIDPDRPRTVTAVLDTHTGASSLYIRNDPRPWFAPSMRAELALDYGYKRDRDAPVFRAGARVDLLQIKALHFGLTGSVDSDSAWFVGAGIRLAIP